jgi:ubiquinone biosynthesis protein UbiJ
MTTTARPWPPFVLRTIERSLNAALKLDPDAPTALAGLHGKRVALTLQPFATPVVLSVVDGAIVASDEAETDVSISATPGALLSMLAERGGLQLPAGKISFSGDVELARRLQKAVEQLRPDWDAPIAKVFGDVAGHQIATGLRGLFGYARESARSLLLNTTEYLREESRDLIAPGEMAAFTDAVDTLRDDVERAAERVERLLRSRQR